MRLIEWVRKNREEIDYVIKHTAGNIKITDEDIKTDVQKKTEEIMKKMEKYF